MTAQTLDPSVTIADRELPKKNPYAVERPRFPLVLKLFGLTAILIVIVVGVAVGITIERANRVAGETVNASITSAAKLFKGLEQQRLASLELPTKLLGNDPSFAALIQSDLAGEAPAATPADPAAPAAAPVSSGPNLPSLADQIEQRREAFGSDLLILLDDQGRAVFRSDKPSVTTPSGDDLYDSIPLVRRVIDDNLESTKGVAALGGKLYHAAVAPIGIGTPRAIVGYLVNGLAIDEKFANQIAESTNAGVVFAPKGSENSGARSSNAPSVAMQMTGANAQPANVTIDGSQYVRIGEPLLSGGQPVGAAIFLRSLDRELAPFRQIEQALFIGGGAALLLAFLLSWLIAKRVTRPIEQLAGMAQAVTAGDYTVQPDINRTDEVGILGRSFAKMITSLRDSAELEELYEQMAERNAEAASATKPAEAAKLDEGTVLVTDLRGLPATVGDGDAANVVAAVERAMRIQEAEVQRQDGEVREILGHRLVSVFRGERGIIHAIRAARAINEELAIQLGANAMTVGAGVATGEFVTGGVELKRESGLAIVGNAPQVAMLFAWHAPSGYAYIAYDAAQAAGGEILAGATRREVKLDWLQQPLPVAALPMVGMNTGLMRSIGSATATMATMKMDGTVPGVTSPAQPAMDLAVGHVFAGRYRIEQILGRGGMGVVYKATDAQLDETVAIKTLPGDVMTRSPEDLERFKREIRLARKITHRNVLRTFDYGEAEGVYFISMEFVRGFTLSELLDEAPSRQMAPRVAVGVARQISRGLQAAHEQGIIHRDIKPQNVLIDAKGEVKLMDFGIARLAEAPEAAQMTQAGLIVGTPHYMSPEQVQGKTLDARSDVYSMGVLLFEMLIGKRPFESSSLTGVLAAHITEQAKAPSELRPEVGRELNAIVLRCLAKDPKTRYTDAGALLADLEKVQQFAAAA